MVLNIHLSGYIVMEMIISTIAEVVITVGIMVIALYVVLKKKNS